METIETGALLAIGGVIGLISLVGLVGIVGIILGIIYVALTSESQPKVPPSYIEIDGKRIYEPFFGCNRQSIERIINDVNRNSAR